MAEVSGPNFTIILILGTTVSDLLLTSRSVQYLFPVSVLTTVVPLLPHIPHIQIRQVQMPHPPPEGMASRAVDLFALSECDFLTRVGWRLGL